MFSRIALLAAKRLPGAAIVKWEILLPGETQAAHEDGFAG